MKVYRTEFPNPQFERENWLCLNGEWDFEIDNAKVGKEKGYQNRPSLDGKINVPFAPESELIKMREKGQIATQYCDLDGNPTMLYPYNPNGSAWAIEGITSPDGRVYGKMGHTERTGENLYKNYTGNFDMKLFESGVKYFK